MNDDEAAALVAKAARGGPRKGRAGRRTQLIRDLEPWFQALRDDGDTWDDVAAKLVALPGYGEAFGTLTGYQLATVRSHARKGQRKPTIEEQVQAAVSKILLGLARAAEAPDNHQPPAWAESQQPVASQPAAPAAAPTEPKPATPDPAPTVGPRSLKDMTTKTGLSVGPTTQTEAGAGLPEDVLNLIRNPSTKKD